MRIKDSSTMVQSESVTQVASDSPFEPVFCLAAAKWRNKDISLVSFEYISLRYSWLHLEFIHYLVNICFLNVTCNACRVADFHLELEQEVILSLLEMFRAISSRFQRKVITSVDSTWYPFIYGMECIKKSSADDRPFVKERVVQDQSKRFPLLAGNGERNSLLPSIVPIGAPWQQIYLLAGRQRKIYIEVFDVAPIKLTLR